MSPKSKKKNIIEQQSLRNREDIGDLEVGGFAPLIDAFMLILRHFDSDWKSGINIMQKLLPPKGDSTR